MIVVVRQEKLHTVQTYDIMFNISDICYVLYKSMYTYHKYNLSIMHYSKVIVLDQKYTRDQHQDTTYVSFFSSCTFVHQMEW